MHKAQMNFCQHVKERFPEHFTGRRVVDFGSLDINGNNRYLFSDCEYFGVDIGPGPNVDLVSPAHLINLQDVDVAISTEMLEHDVHWRETIQHAVDMLKPVGLLVFTCASTGRGEHGTRRSSPADSPYTLDYYRNLTAEDVKDAVDMGQFSEFEFAYNPNPGDLYFWGVKK